MTPVCIKNVTEELKACINVKSKYGLVSDRKRDLQHAAGSVMKRKFWSELLLGDLLLQWRCDRVLALWVRVRSSEVRGFLGVSPMGIF